MGCFVALQRMGQEEAAAKIHERARVRDSKKETTAASRHLAVKSTVHVSSKGASCCAHLSKEEEDPTI